MGITHGLSRATIWKAIQGVKNMLVITDMDLTDTGNARHLLIDYGDTVDNVDNGRGCFILER